MQYITEEQIDQIANDTCAALAKEEKVRVRIETHNGKPFWEGGVNGYFFRIRANTPVDVPKSLAALIAASGKARVLSEARVRDYQKRGGRKVL